MTVARRLCPLSPTIDATFGSDSTVGERAGVRGPERETWPPHPNPGLMKRAEAGGRGASGVEGFYCAPGAQIWRAGLATLAPPANKLNRDENAVSSGHPNPLPRKTSTCGADVARGGEGAEYRPWVNAPAAFHRSISWLLLLILAGLLSSPVLAQTTPATPVPVAATASAETATPAPQPVAEAHPEAYPAVTFEKSKPVEYLATLLFALAILHTFSVKFFAKLANKYPEGSIQENLYHFLAETEVVFGVWATALFFGIAAFRISISQAVAYIEAQDYTEPKFVMAVMVVAATRPVVALAEKIISYLAQLLPLPAGLSFFMAALSVGPLLGSFITEPAAMTLLAMMLKRQYFDQGISKTLAYATIGLLFVNVSIGGTLTHFAAPPVVMVAEKWGWGTWHMLTHFGWRAVASCLLSTVVVAALFRKELSTIQSTPAEGGPVPKWLTGSHLAFLAAIVMFAHHPDVMFGVFMLFLGLVVATKEYQDSLKLREGLLVGFFLAGLVTLGALQEYWLQPLITSIGGSTLYFGATALTAITDNAALTNLGGTVQGISEELKYALMAGAVTGGGLTVIANAPNPAGAGILQSSKVFEETGISPLGLFLGALFPTLVAITMFWFVP